mmetsp:Transcript_32235/g.86008  ORF Transcript_32235/g.86008 Transcript_32235/m.86008 type:complete len:876 (-) Transcript_32235:184-2811(-)
MPWGMNNRLFTRTPTVLIRALNSSRLSTSRTLLCEISLTVPVKVSSQLITEYACIKGIRGPLFSNKAGIFRSILDRDVKHRNFSLTAPKNTEEAATVTGHSKTIAEELADAIYDDNNFSSKKISEIEEQLLQNGWCPEVVNRFNFSKDDEPSVTKERWRELLLREWSWGSTSSSPSWQATSQIESVVHLLEHAAVDYKFRDFLGYYIMDPLYPLGAWKYITYSEASLLAKDMRKIFSVDFKMMRGSRLAIVSRNSVDMAVACWAAWSIGAVVVPVSESAGLEFSLQVMEQAKVDIALYSNFDILDQVSNAQKEGRVPELRKHAVLDGLDPKLHHEETSFAFLLSRARKTYPLPDAVDVRRDDAALIVYSAGAGGGSPKGALHSHRAVIASALAADLGKAGRKAFGQSLGHRLRETTAAAGSGIFGKELVDTVRRGGKQLDVSMSILSWSAGGALALSHELIAAARRGGRAASAEGLGRLVHDMQEVCPSTLFAPGWVLDQVFRRAEEEWTQDANWRRLVLRAAISLTAAPSNVLQKIVIKPVAERLVFRRLRKKFGGKLKRVVALGPVRPNAASWIRSLDVELSEVFATAELGALAQVSTSSKSASILTDRPVPPPSVAGGRGRNNPILEPLPGVTLKICPLGKSVVDGTRDAKIEEGEICAKRSNFAPVIDEARSPCSLNKLKETGNRWFGLGDLGRLDSSGHIRLSGRVDTTSSTPASVLKLAGSSIASLQFLSADMENLLVGSGGGAIISAAAVTWREDGRLVLVVAPDLEALEEGVRARIGEGRTKMSADQLLVDGPSMGLVQAAVREAFASEVGQRLRAAAGGADSILWDAVAVGADWQRAGQLKALTDDRRVVKTKLLQLSSPKEMKLV